MLTLLCLMACAGAPSDPAPAAPQVRPAAGPGPIHQAYPPPEGYLRQPADAFGSWLGARRVLEADVPIRTFDGAVVAHHGRVVDLPMVPGDLQQCADSAIRLRAEWLRESGEPISFHATSGDPLPWARFRDGERPVVVKDRIAWREGSSGSWEDYLGRVFTWAGTDSLARLDTVAAETPAAGDLLVQGGFPGHAVVLLDVARDAEGRWVLLVGEGFMPAQSFHVEHGPLDGWWPWDGTLDLGHWAFDASHLRRFGTP